MSLSNSDLQGGLLLRLLQDDSTDGDLKTLEKWDVPQARLNVYLTSTRKIDDEIEKNICELQDAEAFRAPQSLGQLELKISHREKARAEWSRELLKGVVFKKMKHIERLEKEALELRFEKQRQKETLADLRLESQKQNEVLRCSENEAEKLRDEVQQMAVSIEDFDKKVLELGVEIQQQRDVIGTLRMKLEDNAKQVPLRIVTTDKRVKELDDELQTTGMLLKLTRQMDQADKLHRIESDALKQKAQRAEAFVERFQTALRAFRMSLEDIESTYCSLEKGMSETRPRSVERTNLADAGQKTDRKRSAKNENNTEPELRREMDPDKQEVGSKRMRNSRQNAVPEVCTHPPQDSSTFPTATETEKVKISQAGEGEIRVSRLKQPLESMKQRRLQPQAING